MLTGRKLLLADDSLTIQKVVSLTFEDEEMEVTTVGGGAEALEHLGESLPDIVLADVFMPEPNGYALCERIKRDARTRHIPVVLLVGTFEPFNEAEARRVGADEVLTKPFQSIRDLVNKVGGLLGGQPDEKRPDAADAHHERRDEEATRDLSPFAANARAADPAPETAAATPAPADAFADFDMDDATIQTTPAAAFDAQQQHAAPDFTEIKVEEQFSDRGETDEAFVLSEDDAVMSNDAAMLSDDDAILSADDTSPAPEVHAATATAATSHAGAHAAAHMAESAFETHASRADEADDALLDIGDIAPARAASTEADDFILDIGDEDSFDSAVFAPDAAHDAATAEADMFFAEHAQTTGSQQAFTMPGASPETEASAESQSSEDAQMFAAKAEMPASSAQDAFAEAESAPALYGDAPEELKAPEISEPPALLFANEPAPDTQEAESSPEQAAADGYAQHAPVWDGEPAAASAVAHAGSVAALVEASGESLPTESVAANASSATGASVAGALAASSETGHTASSESNQAASATTASSLSPEMLDEVVRRVVAHMSEQVVREIAWEVVPDLAERLIKQRLEEERSRTQ